MSQRRVRRLRAHRVAKLDELVDQIVSMTVEFGCGEPCEHRVEGGIASRGLVDNPDAIKIAVEAALQAQFHDCGAQKACALILQRNIDETAIFILQGEKEKLLRNCQQCCPPKLSARRMPPQTYINKSSAGAVSSI